MRVLESLRKHQIRGQDRGTPQPSVEPDSTDPAGVLKVLYDSDRKPEPGRPGSDIIHASSFCYAPKCARMLVLTKALREAGVTFSEQHHGAMRLVWAFGRAAENHVRETLMRDPAMRARAYGNWHCRCRRTTSRGHIPASPIVCPHCGTKADRYGEITLHDPDNNISGNPDLLMQEPKGSATFPYYAVWETKSITDNPNTKKGSFSTLEVPIPAHVEQGAHYVRLGRVNGLPMVRKPVILYINKAFSMKGWYKALIPGDRMMQQAEEDVDAAVAAARQCAEAVRVGALPGMIPLCAENPRAKMNECPAWSECMA